MLPLSHLNQLDEMLIHDRYVILGKIKHKHKSEHIEDALKKAVARYQYRNAKRPNKINFSLNLPVIDKKQQISDAIQQHQVIIISGETGSGKTTQIPKICLDIGLGAKGLIGHTQPRRIAARTVAARIAEELDTEIGTLVGYKVRFSDQVSDSTFIKLMTDGILLAEIQQDKLLLKYDTIIIDEAHERSLNIDFILGYLKQLLPKRPDLKVIITSATIDVARFSSHFHDAPIIEVSGRTYPVEVRYRPINKLDQELSDTQENAYFQAIIDAIDELYREPFGDILIFLTGEREVRDVFELLSRLELKNTDILPLFARLSVSEQNKIFRTHNKRRIILATNVAETSLTVPGIKYVIDPGLARISRYSYRTKIQRLPIEPISQASANQRKGRCGRTSDGICIRLYDEVDYLSRPEFTEPEILRTNLASVILQMTALGLGDISTFPFVEAPDTKYIKDGLKLLEELGAINIVQSHYKLTAIGKTIAQLPIDPKLARMIVEAQKKGCMQETMIITAALSIQDPRERPFNKQQASDEKHKRFMDKQSDFRSYLNLWQYIKLQQSELSANQFRRLCQKEFLNFLRIREWQDVYSQIRQTVKQLGMPINSSVADYQSLHTALLTGYLAQIGMKQLDKQEYVGARNIKFSIFPNSAIFKHAPQWCVVSELVETSKLWGRVAAKIEPEWLESIAKHLIKYHYSEPRWSKKQGCTVANEKVTLFGLPIVTNRRVNYGKIDPKLCREFFIRHALVGGEWTTGFAFFQKNQNLLSSIETLEHKARRQDIRVDDEVLFEFYNNRIAQEVVSTAHFNAWWNKKILDDAAYLDFEEQFLLKQSAEWINQQNYPDFWLQGNIKLPITYQFDIGNKCDGVTIKIPLPILNQIENKGFDWHVLGFRKKLIVALIKSLPKSIRRSLVPAPNYADAFLNNVYDMNEPLLDCLELAFKKMTGINITRENWQLEQIPDYLKINFSIIDNDKEIQSGKNLSILQTQLKENVQKTLSTIHSTSSNNIEKSNIIKWDFGDLPSIYQENKKNYSIKAYPALVDNKTSISIKLVDSELEQQTLTKLGLRRLIILTTPSPMRYLQQKLPNQTKLGFYFVPFGSVSELIDDCIACGIDELITTQGDILLNEEYFNKLVHYIKGHLNELVIEIANCVEQILFCYSRVAKKLKGKIDLRLAYSLSDIKKQLSGLVYKGFVSQSGRGKLADILRYLNAIEKRIEKLNIDPSKDRANITIIEELEATYNALINKTPANQQPAISTVRWMIEELRVSLFAQQLGTAYPISSKRIKDYLKKINIT